MLVLSGTEFCWRSLAGASTELELELELWYGSTVVRWWYWYGGSSAGTVVVVVVVASCCQVMSLSLPHPVSKSSTLAL